MDGRFDRDDRGDRVCDKDGDGICLISNCRYLSFRHMTELEIGIYVAEVVVWCAG